MRHTIGRLIVVAALVGLLLWAGRGDVAGQGAGGTRSDSVVKATASAEKPDADGKQVITVKLAVEKGWHVYANPIGAEVGIPTKVTVEGKKPEDVQIDYPKGRAIQDPMEGTYRIYEDEAAIKVSTHRTGDDSPLKLKVKFQACTGAGPGGKCLAAATVELSVP
jgi:DsbC/DsbD-like thiol-disulfide interchange protein